MPDCRLKVRRLLQFLTTSRRSTTSRLAGLFVGSLPKVVIPMLSGPVRDWTVAILIKFQLAVRGAEHRGLPTARYGMESHDSSLQFEPADSVAPTRAVLEALIADGEYPTGEQGRTAVATLVAAHVSDQQGHRTVSTGEALPRELRFPYP